MISTFLHGVGMAKLALRMNVISLGVVPLLVPFVGLHSVLGCALVLGAAKVVRLIAASCIVAQIVRREPVVGTRRKRPDRSMIGA
jgi:hypothetical protein